MRLRSAQVVSLAKGTIMKKAFWYFIATLFVATMAAAQSNSVMGNGSESSGPDPKPELRTVVGCLSRTANTYVITGGAPGPKQFRIIGGDTSALKGRIGHTVLVVGMVGMNDPVENMITPYNEGTTTGVRYNTIVAQRIREVYGNCSEAGKEYAGDHK